MELNFREKVYQVVKQIPKGKTLNYKEVTKLAGYPLAWRAVGNALNKNKNLKIPCHRVIRSDRKIGGYNRGVKRKISLLLKENIVIKKGKVVL